MPAWPKPSSPNGAKYASPRQCLGFRAGFTPKPCKGETRRGSFKGNTPLLRLSLRFCVFARKRKRTRLAHLDSWDEFQANHAGEDACATINETAGFIVNGHVVYAVCVVFAIGNLSCAAPTTPRATPEPEPAAEPVSSERIAAEALKRFGSLATDAALTDYVNLLGKALSSKSARPQTPLVVAVLASETPQILSASDGHVFLTVGALRAAQSEAELAGALAHEIGHVACGHLARAVDLATTTSLAPPRATRFSRADAAMSILFDRGWDEAQEEEADDFATATLAATGYNPWGLKRYCMRLRATPANAGWAATHPNLEARVERLAKRLNENYADYAARPWNTDRYFERALARLPHTP